MQTNSLLENIYITVVLGGIILSYQSALSYFVKFSRHAFSSKCSLSLGTLSTTCNLDQLLLPERNPSVFSFFYYWLLWAELALYYFIAATFLSGFALAAFITKALPYNDDALITFTLIELSGVLLYYSIRLLCAHKSSDIGIPSEQLW